MNEFMKVAKELADNNLKTNSGGPFGAVVIKNGIIIGKGANSVLKDHDPTCHAEINAIREACKNLNTHDLSGCELYTNCFPCPMCSSAIIWANIKKVYFGNTKEDADAIGFRDDMIFDDYKDSKIDELELTCIDRDETIKTFEEYSKKDDKTLY